MDKVFCPLICNVVLCNCSPRVNECPSLCFPDVFLTLSCVSLLWLLTDGVFLSIYSSLLLAFIISWSNCFCNARAKSWSLLWCSSSGTLLFRLLASDELPKKSIHEKFQFSCNFSITPCYKLCIIAVKCPNYQKTIMKMHGQNTSFKPILDHVTLTKTFGKSNFFCNFTFITFVSEKKLTKLCKYIKEKTDILIKYQ